MNTMSLFDVRRVLRYTAMGIMPAQEVARMAHAALQESYIGQQNAQTGNVNDVLTDLVAGIVPSQERCKVAVIQVQEMLDVDVSTLSDREYARMSVLRA